MTTNEHEIDDLLGVGSELIRSNRRKEAVPVFLKAIDLWEQGERTAHWPLARAIVGLLAGVAHDQPSTADPRLLDQAHRWEQRLVAILEDPNDLGVEARVYAWGRVGGSASGYGRLADACRYYGNALDLSRRSETRSVLDEIPLCLMLGDALSRFGDIDRAIKTCDDGLNLSRQVGEVSVRGYVASLLFTKARCLVLSGRFTEAIDVLSGLRMPARVQPEVDQCMDLARRKAKCHMDIDGNLVEDVT